MTAAGLTLVGTAAPAGAATPIYADAQNPPFTAKPIRVQLTQDFAQICPPGWPSPPSETGAGVANPWCRRTIPAGTVITLFACVATALIAAGAATAD